MALTIQQIEAKIAELRNAQRNTKARNGYYHYEEKISHLRGELMLGKEKHRLEAARRAEEKRIESDRNRPDYNG